MLFTLNERQSAQYTANLVDEAGAPVPAASITSATLTLYDESSGASINGRAAQDVKNANNVTIDANGKVTWSMLPADNAIVDSTKDVEYHRALFTIAWAAGAKQLTHEVRIAVQNLPKIT